MSGSIAPYVILSGIIFSLGVAGLLIRRSALVMLMCVELMWNAANLALVAFARQAGGTDGHVFVFFAITVAAAEVAIGLALIVMIFRRRQGVDADAIAQLKG